MAATAKTAGFNRVIGFDMGGTSTDVAHFEGEMGIGAHSYFRYSTHLSLLLMAAIASMLHGWSPPRLVPGWRRALPALAVALVLLDPIPFARLLRFDLEIPNLRVWRIARAAAPLLAPGEKLVLVLPGDNGSVAPALETVLRDAPPRRPDLEIRTAKDLGAAFAIAGFDHALLSRRPCPAAGRQRGAVAARAIGLGCGSILALRRRARACALVASAGAGGALPRRLT